MRKNKPLIIGVTGGIGSGKSLVCSVFNVLGAPCYNADRSARLLMEDDPEVITEIKKLFGNKAYNASGQLNRDHVARIAFEDKNIVQKLNAIVHPAVGRDFSSWINKNDHPYVIKEAALLIESGSYKSLNFLINVQAPLGMRINRVLKRDPYRSKEELVKIIDNQLSDEDRNMNSDFILNNNNEKLLVPQILELDQKFQSGFTKPIQVS